MAYRTRTLSVLSARPYSGNSAAHLPVRGYLELDSLRLSGTLVVRTGIAWA